jgi:hypothetical protein
MKEVVEILKAWDKKLVDKHFNTKQDCIDFMYLFNLDCKIRFASIFGKYYISFNREGNEKAAEFNFYDLCK